MKKINLYFTLSSISVLLVTIERFSFTAKILLEPYNFLRLHEMVQMVFIITLTVIIPFLLLKEVTDNFESFKTKKGFYLALLFVIGVYFYATGNGLHEISSFNFNIFCDTKNFSGDLCNGFFFNDFYTGNILYFVGGAGMVISLMLFELVKPNKTFEKKDFKILIINAVVYALAIFAYSGFDRVLVGLVYSVIITAISIILYLRIKSKYWQYPIISYTVLTYFLGTVASLLVRIVNK